MSAELLSEHDVERRFFDELDAALRADKSKGLAIVASCKGGEPVVEVMLEAEEPRINWIVNQPERPLSQAVLDDNDSRDEVERIVSGLRVTILVLENALKHGDLKP